MSEPIRSRFHACDTEVIDIDLSEQYVRRASVLFALPLCAGLTAVRSGCLPSACVRVRRSPVGNGRIICASIFAGPDLDFGNGPRIWIDNLDGAAGTLELFRPYFEDASIRKVWHNYGFDRHVFWNHTIDVKGFGGDTMHMARLWNSGNDDCAEHTRTGDPLTPPALSLLLAVQPVVWRAVIRWSLCQSHC
jgi:hypothetical protein